ncbi:MAG TPA: thermonuclease family protein [Chitinolyticbacter sp.]|nr:thermonuclease family protein [Chitinolyticbacter sp.]
MLWCCLLLAGCLDLDLPRGEAVKGEIVEGRVIAVADGDTLTVLDDGLVEHKLRLAFVDAPEKAQAFGNVAKWQLSSRVYGRAIRAELIDVDRYGRGVARVWLGGEDVNLALLNTGYAWHYTRYAERIQSGTEFARYAAAERQARAGQLGLWQGARPQPPWQYRQRKRAGT